MSSDISDPQNSKVRFWCQQRLHDKTVHCAERLIKTYLCLIYFSVSGWWAHCVGARRFIPPIFPSSFPTGQWEERTPEPPAAPSLQSGPDSSTGHGQVGNLLMSALGVEKCYVWLFWVCSYSWAPNQFWAKMFSLLFLHFCLKPLRNLCIYLHSSALRPGMVCWCIIIIFLQVENTTNTMNRKHVSSLVKLQELILSIATPRCYRLFMRKNI